MEPEATEGKEVSPKVARPAIALAGLGVVAIIASYIVSGPDDLAEIGLALVGASGVTAGVGYHAPPA